MKKVLEMKDPIINTYTSYGTLFSIMHDNLWSWIYNNFIQIRYAKTWGMFVFDQHHVLLKNCPGVSYYSLSQELIIPKYGKK
ncbi:hypothetical protein [Gracilibacillus timonensis]|uniref:hypothetical protein n=1 Tax=Gracilibacillus timonensis TaxID=1816696 RepID=UPI0011DCB4FA|nr:hypothetical protein [Gracilibacillus timonensis]